MMKNLLYVLSSIFILAACQNQQRKKETSFSNSDKVVVIESYPASHAENIEDTLVDEHLHLYIQTSSLENSFIEHRFDKNEDTIVSVRYYDFEAEIELFVDEASKFHTTITKELFAETMEEDFPKNAILQAIWFDTMTDSGEIKLRLSICQPETDYCYFYHLFIDAEFNFRFELEEIT